MPHCQKSSGVQNWPLSQTVWLQPQSLSDVLASAYKYNPRLDAERARQRATDEEVAKANSGYRPTVNGAADIGYSRTDNNTHQQNLDSIARQWTEINKPLIVFLVTFTYSRKLRHFQELQTHEFARGKHSPLRTQEALPWQVAGTKWKASAYAKADG